MCVPVCCLGSSGTRAAFRPVVAVARMSRRRRLAVEVVIVLPSASSSASSSSLSSSLSASSWSSSCRSSPAATAAVIHSQHRPHNTPHAPPCLHTPHHTAPRHATLRHATGRHIGVRPLVSPSARPSVRHSARSCPFPPVPAHSRPLPSVFRKLPPQSHTHTRTPRTHIRKHAHTCTHARLHARTHARTRRP